MTATEYIDEVILRLHRHGIATNISYPMVLTYINKARRKVQAFASNLMPERYADIIRIDYDPIHDEQQIDGTLVRRFPIQPDNLVEIEVAILDYIPDNLGQRRRQECRRVNIREFHSVRRHYWNRPSLSRPIYTLLRDNQHPIERQTIRDYIHLDWGPSDMSVLTNNPVLEVWYIKAIDDIEDLNEEEENDIDANTPPDMRELVILYAMIYCCENMNIVLNTATIEAEIRQISEMIKQNYVIEEQRNTVELPSKEGI